MVVTSAGCGSSLQVLAIANIKSRGDTGSGSRRPSVQSHPGSPTRTASGGSAGSGGSGGGSSGGASADRIGGIRLELLKVAGEFEVMARRVGTGDAAVGAASADEARRLARATGDTCLQLMDELRGLPGADRAPQIAATDARSTSPGWTPTSSYLSPTGMIPGESIPASLTAVDTKSTRAAEEKTFFSQCQVNFSVVLATPEAGQAYSIKADEFLAAASAIIPFLDRLGSALSIVSKDISGNIEKIRVARSRNPADSVTLEDIVRDEVRLKRTTTSDAASDALLWLKRALRFICAFMSEFADGKETATAAGLAYSRTLAHYHGWLVRGAFSMAMKSVPYRNDLLKQLGPGPEHVIIADSAAYVADLDSVLTAVEKLLAGFGLDKDEKV